MVDKNWVDVSFFGGSFKDWQSLLQEWEREKNRGVASFFLWHLAKDVFRQCCRWRETICLFALLFGCLFVVAASRLLGFHVFFFFLLRSLRKKSEQQRNINNTHTLTFRNLLQLMCRSKFSVFLNIVFIVVFAVVPSFDSALSTQKNCFLLKMFSFTYLNIESSFVQCCAKSVGGSFLRWWNIEVGLEIWKMSRGRLVRLEN